MSSPAFKHVCRPAYELPGLIKGICAADHDKLLDDETRDAVEAASSHAHNAKETLLDGIESIGNLLIRLSALDDPIEQRDLMGIGGVIRHAAVEVQYLTDVMDEMDRIMHHDNDLAKKGGVK